MLSLTPHTSTLPKPAGRFAQIRAIQRAASRTGRLNPAFEYWLGQPPIGWITPNR
jgi:hypothetical protein